MADVKQWITVHPNGKDNKGQPIPVKEGQTKSEAVKSFVSKKQGEESYRQNASYGEILSNGSTIKNDVSAGVKKPHTDKTQVYEVHASTSYKSNGTTHHNYRKEYVKAESEQDAKKILEQSLKKDGNFNIKISDTLGIALDEWDDYVKRGLADDSEIINNDEYEKIEK